MSYSPKVGDWVTLLEKDYIVNQVDNDHIWISSSNQSDNKLLIPSDKGYLIYSTDGVPRQVEFSKGINLTGDPFLDTQILINLSDEDLERVCKVNPQLCENQELWRAKIERRFGDMIRFLSGTSPKQLYNDLKEIIRLSNIDNRWLTTMAGQAAIDGKIYLLNVLESYGYYPSRVILDYDLNQEVRKWLLERQEKLI